MELEYKLTQLDSTISALTYYAILSQGSQTIIHNLRLDKWAYLTSSILVVLSGSLTISGDIFVCTIWGQEVATEICLVRG